ncbi:MAG TPA: ComEC/Rec2 family competence protein [Ktedonobacteraceae bacterium]|nr:ComEC/Rec2 family competence protein [Ktedonobacteraceae bacterium]
MMLRQEHIHVKLRGLTLAGFAAAWLAGMLLASCLPLPPLSTLIGSGAALIFVVLLRRDEQGCFIMCLLLCMLLGAWRYGIASPGNDPHAIAAFIGPRALTIRGAVADEPELQGRSRVLIIAVDKVSSNGGASWQEADGQIEVRTPGDLIENPYGPNYGDSVELQGKLQPPEPHSSPEILANMTFPRLSVESTGGNPVLAFLYHLRVVLASIIARALPQPEAALLIAILLSIHTPALKPLLFAFNATGTAHLVAPSGFKVTVLAGLVARCTSWLDKSRKQPDSAPPPHRRQRWRSRVATALMIASIAIYSLLSGAGPAALRAGIMGILLVIAPRPGRSYNIYTALALTALLMSLADPFVLWNAGFQLSFLGTLGIVLLTPLFQRLLHPVEHIPLGYHIAEIIAVTLAAQVATLPISAITFQEISFIAPITNILTVPLLGLLILLGTLICGAGLVLPPLAALCGWVAWPLLWYVTGVVTWNARLPGAYVSVENMGSSTAWAYYGVLALLTWTALKRWPTAITRTHTGRPRTLFPGLTTRLWRTLQFGAALIVIMATGTAALLSSSDGQLAITFLDVGPANQPPQGEAILITTRDHQTMLIDGGPDAAALAQALDTRLPPWQRSLSAVLLTTPRADHMTGLQDVVSRYQIGTVIDAGMLHPSVAYALWRKTIAERRLHYLPVVQGTILALGAQVRLQVVWPTSHLHKGSNETLDNSLVFRLVAPGLRVLFLGAAALSPYALEGIMAGLDLTYLQADIVQIVGAAGKAFPAALSRVLTAAHPSRLVITPAAFSPKLRMAGYGAAPVPPAPLAASWQTLQTAQAGTLEISSKDSTWNMSVETSQVPGRDSTTSDAAQRTIGEHSFSSALSGARLPCLCRRALFPDAQNRVPFTTKDAPLMDCKRCAKKLPDGTPGYPARETVHGNARETGEPATHDGSCPQGRFGESSSSRSAPPPPPGPDPAAHYQALPVSAAPQSSPGAANHSHHALLVEFILSLVGIFGVGWLLAGETLPGRLLLICSFLVYWPVLIVGTILTAGLGLICLGPIAIGASILNILLLTRVIRRKAAHFVVPLPPPPSYPPPPRL